MRPLICSLILASMISTNLPGEEPAAGKQVEQELKVDGKAIPYLLYLPKEYGNQGTRVPLMLFLHGRGESDGPLSIVKKWGPPHCVERGVQFPFALASPQCPRKESWAQASQQALLVSLLDHLTRSYAIDTNRIYLAGLSMGGYGTWRLAADHPALFAAAVPVCGGGNVQDAESLKNLPIWVWHGTEDGAVPFQRSVEMVEAISKAGGKSIRFTSLENIGHNSWEAAFWSPDLYQWLAKQAASQNLARATAAKP
jgi:predicted peptidase